MSPKRTKKILFWGKTVVFIVLLAYIIYVLQQQRFDWAVVQRQFRQVDYPLAWATALLLLTPINWGLEALKWQILLQRVESVTFGEAYKGVLAGVTLGFALPAQLGDTAGRLLSLRTNRSGAVGASLVSGGMQFYVAIIFGAVAWAHQLQIVPERATVAGLLLLGLLTLLVGLGIALGLFRRPLLGWLAGRRIFARTSAYWIVANQYDDREIGLGLAVAASRYVVFSAQFYVAMRLLGIDLPPGVVASGIGLVYLVKTIAPAFNLLSDLGVREAAALWVFAPFGVPASVLLTATLTLWVANVLMPVLVGLIWVWKLKLTAS